MTSRKVDLLERLVNAIYSTSNISVVNNKVSTIIVLSLWEVLM